MQFETFVLVICVAVATFALILARTQRKGSVLQSLNHERATQMFGENALRIMCLFAKKEKKIVMVGGAPRDAVIGPHGSKKPEDIDFVSNMTEEELQECVLKLDGADMTCTGKNMFVITLGGDKHDMKLVDLLSEDPWTRDIGINTMTCEYNSITGQYDIIDPTGLAKRDIQNRQICFLPGALEENCPRAIRAVRFCAKFGYNLDDKNRKMCCSDDVCRALQQLNPQKLQNEMDKLKQLSPKKYLTAMQLLLEVGIFEHMFVLPVPGNSPELLLELIKAIQTKLPGLQIPTSVLEAFLLAAYYHGQKNVTMKNPPKKLITEVNLYRLLLSLKTLNDGASYMDKISKYDGFKGVQNSHTPSFLEQLCGIHVDVEFPTDTNAKVERRKVLHSVFRFIQTPLTMDERNDLTQRLGKLKGQPQQIILDEKTSFFLDILKDRV